MFVKKADAEKALKLIKMPAPKAKAVVERVAAQEAGRPGDGFDRSNVRGQFNKLASNSVGAGAVGRSVVARAGTPATPESKARSVMRVYDAAGPKGKVDILVAAVRTGLANTDHNFSEDGNKVNS